MISLSQSTALWQMPHFSLVQPHIKFNHEWNIAYVYLVKYTVMISVEHREPDYSPFDGSGIVMWVLESCRLIISIYCKCIGSARAPMWRKIIIICLFMANSLRMCDVLSYMEDFLLIHCIIYHAIMKSSSWTKLGGHYDQCGESW